MILIDSSAWVEFLRDTGSLVCIRVDARDEAVALPDLSFDRGQDLLVTMTVLFTEALEPPAGGIWTVGTDTLRSPMSLELSMVSGMATKKVTITLEEEQLDRIRSVIEGGKAQSVSGFVQHAVGVALDDVAGWGALLSQALVESGGDISDEEQAWADEVLGVSRRSRQTVA